MRRLLNNLFRNFRTTSTSRGSRRAPRRAMLQVEGLEDRLVLSTASPHASTVHVIVEQPTHQIAQVSEFTIKKTTDHASPAFFRNATPQTHLSTFAIKKISDHASPTFFQNAGPVQAAK